MTPCASSNVEVRNPGVSSRQPVQMTHTVRSWLLLPLTCPQVLHTDRQTKQLQQETINVSSKICDSLADALKVCILRRERTDPPILSKISSASYQCLPQLKSAKAGPKEGSMPMKNTSSQVANLLTHPIVKAKLPAMNVKITVPWCPTRCSPRRGLGG